MQLATPYAKIVEPFDGHAALRKIEFCGRISHRSEDAQTEDSWYRFIQAVVLGHGDWSIVEHASATVDFLVDRGITHEIVRHRLFSFTQESTRFVNYEKKMPPSFVEPEFPTAIMYREECRQIWADTISAAEQAYKQLLGKGVAPQIARSIFPNALSSRILITGNLRAWRHFLRMRTTKEAHPQMREVAIPLLAEFKSRVPLLFDDIEPLARQADNVRLPA